MKRTLQFKASEDGYGYYENDMLVFEIKKSDLQFNVKDFYSAFYADGKDYEEIEVENELTSDNEATRIYNSVQDIFKQISDRLNELNQGSNQDCAPEDLNDENGGEPIKDGCVEDIKSDDELL